MKSKSFPGIFRNFYLATFCGWLIWVLFLDNNNIRVVFANRMKMRELEKEKVALSEKIAQKRNERNEVFGNPKMLEKWARERYLMRKPNEDVYVIVDENDRLIESKK